MKISEVCKNYFYGLTELRNWKNNTIEKNAIAILKIVSYFTLIIPLGFAAASLFGRVKKEPPNTRDAELITTTAQNVLNPSSKNDADMFVAGIDRWVNDPSVTGRKEEAAKKIKYAFLESKDFLLLRGMGLNKLPAEIGRLTALTTLDVSWNNLTELPATIGNLSALQELYVFRNTLTELPAEIGRLSALTKLSLQHNQLTELPNTVGELINLTDIKLAHNPKLSILPISLGNVPGITDLDIDGTAILPEQKEAILEACRAKLGEIGQTYLMPKINLWKEYAGYTGDLSFIDNFEQREKNTLYEWLVRLSKTRDFTHSQGELAEAVCEMLADLKDNADWKAFCISQAEANNTNCQDRAAMALNELYTQWKVYVNKGLPAQEKIKLYIGLSKTLALREAIQDRISLQEKNGVSMGESVEIFLYYEIALKEKLGLITAMNKMRYTTIGERDWIKESDLIDAVNTHYINYIIEFEPFKNILEKSDIFKKAWDPLEESFNKRSEELSENKSQMKEQEFVEGNNRLQTEWEKSWKQAAKKAAEGIIKTYNI